MKPHGIKRPLLFMSFLVVCAAAFLFFRPDRLFGGNPRGAEKTCTLAVYCDAALGDSANLNPEVRACLPPDGVIFPESEVRFFEGEHVFDLLLRELRGAGVPLEFQRTPLGGLVYVEGIGNLYEFDCGETSGWLYEVNGVFPGISASSYSLSQGDSVVWHYSLVVLSPEEAD